jgi:hypothetical protein
MSTDVAVVFNKLTDRCDRCGAEAHMRAVLLSGLELLFCAHHGREHHAKLTQVAVIEVD